MPGKTKYLLFVIGMISSCFVPQAAWATEAGKLKINEILVYNDSNYVDDYGMRNSWIEIVNSSYAPIDIGGRYLTDDLNNPKKYWIPVGLPLTVIPPRGYLVFYADNQPTRGILHVNFVLKEGKTIALFEANGKDLIDKLEIGFGHTPDVSLARISPDINEWKFSERTTPNSDNNYDRKATSGELIADIDPSGTGMTAIAMSVVFSALILLFLIFNITGYLFTRRSRKTDAGVVQEKTKQTATTGISGEVNAAIALTLYLYRNEMHDYENTVLTVRKVTRPYSPWSSKIYMLRKTPRG